MADNSVLSILKPESDDLNPLPPPHRDGLIAVTVLASLSFVSSILVLIYLTYKLVRWHLKTWRRTHQSNGQPATEQVDLSLGLAERHLVGEGPKSVPTLRALQKKAHPNQFLVLIYNLLLADIHQSAAFLLNASWVGRNAIIVRTTTCWAQGWLVSTGDLSSSLFITAIAVHTYLVVVWNYTPPQWALYAAVVGLWVFNYLMFILGIALTNNGREAGGLYVRAAAWCWMNIEYEDYRLVLHYLWIFISLAVTSVLYSLIFFSLRRQTSRLRNRQPSTNPTRTRSATANESINSSSSNININPTISPDKTPVATTTAETPATTEALTSNTNKGGHHKAFLLYPVIYVICTLPLALGRIATMAGVDVPISYFCTAAALITSNGWLDVLLWGVTRHRLLFSADVDTAETGLDTFTFMRTPAGRRYGNLVWVEGGGATAGGRSKRESGSRVGREVVGGGDWAGGLGNFGWFKRIGHGGRRKGLGMGWRRLGRGLGGAASGSSGDKSPAGAGRMPAATGRDDGLAIQMDMVTTVVVETAEGYRGPEGGKAGRAGRKDRRGSGIGNGAQTFAPQGRSRVYDAPAPSGVSEGRLDKDGQ